MDYLIEPINYIRIFHFATLLLLIIAFISSSSEGLFKVLRVLSVAYFYILVATIGFRPVDWAFGDMRAYARMYSSNTTILDDSRDRGFYLLSEIMAGMNISEQWYFAFIFLLYITPMRVFSKRHFGALWPYGFLGFLSFFEFFSYGTNGLRNGLACSIFILAMAYNNLKYLRYVLMLIAVLLHVSLILPVGAYIVAIFFKRINFYFILWFSALTVSYFSGDFFTNLFTEFLPQRTNYYLLGDGDIFYKVGFRVDFILYSFLGVLAAYYYLYVRKIQDELYNKLVSVYLFSNGLWLLVVRAYFTNRIAYLSWFLLAPLIVYPLLKIKMTKNQILKACLVILCFFSVSLYLNVLR